MITSNWQTSLWASTQPMYQLTWIISNDSFNTIPSNPQTSKILICRSRHSRNVWVSQTIHRKLKCGRNIFNSWKALRMFTNKCKARIKQNLKIRENSNSNKFLRGLLKTLGFGILVVLKYGRNILILNWWTITYQMSIYYAIWQLRLHSQEVKRSLINIWASSVHYLRRSLRALLVQILKILKISLIDMLIHRRKLNNSSQMISKVTKTSL